MPRTPPNSLEAERCVLGACLIEGIAVDRAALALTPDDFYREAHRLVFQACLSLRAAGTPVEYETVSEELAGHGQLEKAGGRPYVIGLTDEVPTATHVDHYAKIVADKAQLRRLLHAAGEIVDTCYGDFESVQEVQDQAESAVRAARGADTGKTSFTAHELMEDAATRYFTAHGMPKMITGVPTGFSQLDEVTNGFQAGDLIIVAAETSGGKTAFALNVMRHAAGEKCRCLLFSLEMTARQVADRLVQADARVPSQVLRTGDYTEEQEDRIFPAIEEIRPLPFEVETMKPLTPMRALSRARVCEGMGLVIVDYLTMMDANRRDGNRRLEVEEITAGLKAMAQELQVPVIVLSQFSRPGDRDKANVKPTIHRLRESGGIGNDADLVILMWRNEEDEKTYPKAADGVERRLVDLLVVKHRNGRTGTIKQVFLADYALFVDRAEDQN